MSKFLKVFGIVVATLMVLLIVAGILLTNLLNPNDYKNKISQTVFQATGHELKINGNISWSFFPWLGLKVNNVALSNVAGFGNNDLATIKEADVKVSLLPLFLGKVDVNNITLNNLQLNLVKNRDGVGNWQNPHAKNIPAQTTPEENKNSISKPGFSIAVNNIDITDSNINWQNAQNGQNISLKNLNLEGEDIAFNSPFSLSFSTDIVGNNPNLKTHIDINGDFDINGGFSRFSLTNFSAAIDSLKINGSVTGGIQDDVTNYAGNLTIEKVNLKKWLSNLGMNNLNTADDNALTEFSGKINFKGTNNSFNMNKIALTLDDTHLTGNIAIQNFKTQAINFQLQADQLNADRYMLATTKSSSTNTTTSNSSTSQNLPVASLRALNINGTLNINQFTLMKLKTSNATVTIAANNGLLKLTPVKANLYNGSTTTYLTYDVRNDDPTLSITSNTQNVQIQPLLTDLMNIKNISGATNFSLDVTARGANTTNIMNTLNGNGQFSLLNGKFIGINLDYQVQRAQALFSRTTAPSQPASNDTDIGTARGTVKIANGIASNNDLTIQTAVLNAAGQGTVNLPNQSMDYTLFLIPTQAGNLQGQRIPLLISGNFTNLNYKLDIDSLLQAVAKQQAKQQLQKLGNSLNDKGKQLLSGLFNK